jgi:hypothetical protein
LGPGLWLGQLPPSVLSPWLRTASTVARTAAKTGETTEEIGETTAETVASEQTLAQALLVTRQAGQVSPSASRLIKECVSQLRPLNLTPVQRT